MPKQLVNRTWEDVDNSAEFGALSTGTAIDVDIAAADTYEKIDGTYIDTSDVCKLFTVNTDGTLTYNGDGGSFMFFGSSEMDVDSASTTSLALFINQTLANQNGKTFTTPHTFTQTAKVTSVGIVGVVELATDDEIEIYVKSSNTNTVTIQTLSILLKRL